MTTRTEVACFAKGNSLGVETLFFAHFPWDEAPSR
jgi:hypothetical protein